jgi:tetratricopeptide (TPR) repeat protein
MGVVYKARQRGLNRVVALKMILAGGRARRDELERFRAEARAAAQLQHPNIVQVFEIGEHQGLPYFSQEYVTGGSLAARTDGAPLPPRRAALALCALADAVDAAHQKGVVHRDLKPANILLEFRPSAGKPNESAVRPPFCLLGDDLCIPKVADFGLAKRLEDDSSQTREGSVMGTPSYMAPEQAEGKVKEVGPAVDVYALGAILYELLTGRPPFRGASVMETLRQVVSQEVLPPRQLQPRTPPDLETICLKCLNKEPARRYASAAALADDLRRWLEGRPILARPSPWWERAWKWAKRRPAAAALVGVGALTVAGLIAGGFVYAGFEHRHMEIERAAAAEHRHTAEVERAAAQEQRRLRREADEAREKAEHSQARADKNFARASNAVKSLLERVGRARLAHEPRMEQVRRQLLQEAVARQQEFLDEASDDPSVKLDNARTCSALAEVLVMLGDYGEAEKRLTQSLGLLEGLAGRPGEEGFRLNVERERAAAYFDLGRLRRDLRRPDDAERDYRRALALRDGLRRRAPDDVDSARGLAAAGRDLGRLLGQRGRYAEAERLLDEAQRAQVELTRRPDSRPDDRLDLARTRNSLGELYQAIGRTDEARAAFQSARDGLTELVGRRKNPDYRLELAQTHNNLARLLRDVAPAEALGAVADAEKLTAELKEEFPTTPVYRQELAVTLNLRAVLAQSLGRSDDARSASGRALALLRELSERYPWVAEYHQNLAAALNNHGIQLMQQGLLDDADAAYRDSFRELDGLPPEIASQPDLQLERARALIDRGALRHGQQRPADAGADYDEARRILAGLTAAHAEAPEYRLLLARVEGNRGALFQQAGLFAAAEDLYRASLGDLKKLLDQDPAVPDYRHQRALTCQNLATLLRDRPPDRASVDRAQCLWPGAKQLLGALAAERDRARIDQAQALYGEAKELLARLDADLPEVHVYRVDLGRTLNEWALLLAVRDAARAGKLWAEAAAIQETLVKEFPKEPAYRQELARTRGNLGLLASLANDLSGAVRGWSAAVAVLDGLDSSVPRGAAYRQDLLTQLTNLDAVLPRIGSRQEVEETKKRIVEVRRGLVRDFGPQPAYQHDLAKALLKLGVYYRDYNQPGEARAPLEEAVKREREVLKATNSPAARQQLMLCLDALAQALLELNDHAAAARTLLELNETAPDAWPDRVKAAARLAACAAVAAEDKTVAEEERKSQSKAAADAALRVLRQAVDQGFKDAAFLKRSEDFAPLRERDEFKELLKKIEK